MTRPWFHDHTDSGYLKLLYFWLHFGFFFFTDSIFWLDNQHVFGPFSKLFPGVRTFSLQQHRRLTNRPCLDFHQSLPPFSGVALHPLPRRPAAAALLDGDEPLWHLYLPPLRPGAGLDSGFCVTGFRVNDGPWGLVQGSYLPQFLHFPRRDLVSCAHLSGSLPGRCSSGSLC